MMTKNVTQSDINEIQQLKKSFFAVYGHYILTLSFMF